MAKDNTTIENEKSNYELMCMLTLGYPFTFYLGD
jgi:hypothetical protein